MINSQKKMPTATNKFIQWIGSTASLILHTLFFIGIFFLLLFGVTLDSILLVLTTAVSLEAIYLAIFIQMTVNKGMETIAEVGEDIEEIQENVGELQEDLGEIQEDVGEIHGNVKDIGGDIEDISEDIDKIQEEDETDTKNQVSLEEIQQGLQKLLADVESLTHIREQEVEKSNNNHL